MAKKALKIEKFNGGINSDVDARDIAEGQLTSLDNASVDELGKIRVSGGLDWKEHSSALVNTFDEAQLRFPGTGLYSFPIDYLFSGNNQNPSLEASDSSGDEARGIIKTDGNATWKFSQNEVNTNSVNIQDITGQNKVAISYATHAAYTQKDHGSIIMSSLSMEKNSAYLIKATLTSEKPWYYLGSNVPPRLRIYNTVDSYYYYPNKGWSSTSDATFTALLNDNVGNLVEAPSTSDTNAGGHVTWASKTEGDGSWTASGNAKALREQMNITGTISLTDGKAFNSFTGGIDVSGAMDNSYVLKVESASDGTAPTASGNYVQSHNITVAASTTYLFDCFVGDGKDVSGSTPPKSVSVEMINQSSGSASIIKKVYPVSTSFKHITSNNPTTRGIIKEAYAPIEFTTPSGCTSIAIRLGVQGAATQAYFFGMNLRQKMLELGAVVKSHRIQDYLSYPNSYNNKRHGNINSSPYLSGQIDGKENTFYTRTYNLLIKTPSNAVNENHWKVELDLGTWAGLGQTGVNNVIISNLDAVKLEEDADNSFISNNISDNETYLKNRGQLIFYNKGTDSQYNNTKLKMLEYNPHTDFHNNYSGEFAWTDKSPNINFPTSVKGQWALFKFNKEIFFTDTKFQDTNLYQLKRTNTNSYTSSIYNLNGPTITFDALIDSFLDTDTYVTLDEAFNNYIENRKTTIKTNMQPQFPTDVNGGLDSSFIQYGTAADAEAGKATLQHYISEGTGLGFKYDVDDSEWVDADSPYTQYWVLDKDTVIEDSGIGETRVAQINFMLNHIIALQNVDFQHNDGESEYWNYIPKFTIYVDEISDTGEANGYVLPTDDNNYMGLIATYHVNSDNMTMAAGNDSGINYSTDVSGIESSHNYYNINESSGHIENNDGSGIWNEDSYALLSINSQEILSGSPIWPNSLLQGADSQLIGAYGKNYLISINIPYSKEVTINQSTGSNLQIRVVPHVIGGSENFSNYAQSDVQGDGRSSHNNPHGISAEQWEIFPWNNGNETRQAIYSYKSSVTADADTTLSEIDYDVIALNIAFATPTEGAADGWNDTWTIQMTSVNSENLESAFGNAIEVSNTDVTKSPNISIATHIANSNLTHSKFLKCYMKSTRNPVYNLQFTINVLTKNIYTSNKAITNPGHIEGDYINFSLSANDMLIPNEVDSYEAETGVAQDDALNSSTLISSFKSAVIGNNVLYAGNIYQNGVHYPDRILKSPVNKIPLLPASSFIDVAVNDGDSITALAYFKDKLLQFKHKKLYIINISEDYEYLEDSFDGLGVSMESQIVKTKYGITWINETGCYLYDGEGITNLIENKLAYNANNDSVSTWDIKMNFSPVLGYDKKSDKLIIYISSDTPIIEDNEEVYAMQKSTGYVYDFITKSWSMIGNKHAFDIFPSINDLYYQSDDITPNGKTRVPHHKSKFTNFAYDERDNLMILSIPEDYFYIWNDSSQRTTAQYVASFSPDLDEIGTYDSDGNKTVWPHRDFRIITKDYDFGAPSVNKKIYKIYITFKSTEHESYKKIKKSENQDVYNHSNVFAYYSVDGSNNWVEFNKTKSINYGEQGLVWDKTVLNEASLLTASSDYTFHATDITLSSAENVEVGNILYKCNNQSASTVKDKQYNGQKVNLQQTPQIADFIDGNVPNEYQYASEQMKVTKINGNVVTVIRGYNNSIKSSISSGDKFNISNGDWIVAELKPSTSINNIKSIKIKLQSGRRETSVITNLGHQSGAATTSGAYSVPKGFMINDMTIIYRDKNVK